LLRCTIPAAVTFEEYRQSTLESTRQMAGQWRGPESEATHVVLGLDYYDARHVLAIPPVFVRLDAGLLSWLASALPHEVLNRSLYRIALCTSAWVSPDQGYAGRPALDPRRRERVTLYVAERARHEAWNLWIDRDPYGSSQLGEWEEVKAGNEVLIDAVGERLLAALENTTGPRGPTVPATHMVLAALDVPDDFVPISKGCGPVERFRDITWSSFRAIFCPQSPPSMIVSQTLVFWEGYDVAGYLGGMAEVRTEAGDIELRGPAFGDQTRYYGGMTPDDEMYRHMAFWRYSNIYCELWTAGPPGRFGPIDIYRYAGIQDRRVRAELDSGRATEGR
jgi:hypothetical protein